MKKVKKEGLGRYQHCFRIGKYGLGLCLPWTPDPAIGATRLKCSNTIFISIGIKRVENDAAASIFDKLNKEV